jgi:hypothetical protein
VNTEEGVDRLAEEVMDLLDAGRVGLYEFIDQVRGTVPEADQAKVALAALQRLLDRNDVEIVVMRWPAERIGTVEPGALPPDAWDPPDEDGRYLALDWIG